MRGRNDPRQETFFDLTDQRDADELGRMLPFAQEKIDIVSQPIPVYNVIERIRRLEINLRPSYQRWTDLWHRPEQSRLIESLILGMPLQSFYFDVRIVRDASGYQNQIWDVVDGVQRLSALRRFLIDGETFVGLEYLGDYNGRTFAELPKIFQRNVYEAQLHVNLIRAGTPEEVKFNIFKRVNTGGMPLTQQEIRHAMFDGPATEFLEQLSNTAAFREMVGCRVNKRRLQDQEFVNRFLAFYCLDVDDSYRTLDTFLNDALRFVRAMTVDARERLRDVFEDTMSTIRVLLGPAPFGRYNEKRQRFNAKVNKAVFEVLTVQVAKLEESEREILRRVDDFREVYRAFFVGEDGPHFVATISSSTDDKNRILRRHEAMRAFLRDILENNK